MTFTFSNTTGRSMPQVSAPFKLSGAFGIVPQGHQRQSQPVSRVEAPRRVSKPVQQAQNVCSGLPRDGGDAIAALVAMGESKAEANRLVTRAVANGVTTFQEIFVYCTVRS